MNPVIILIGGGTGSGKSTLASNINGRLSDYTTLISMDDYYKDQSGVPEAERELINYDSPEVVDIELLSNNISKLRSGDAIDEPIYDFATHTRRVETTHIESSPVIIVEGIMALRDDNIDIDSSILKHTDQLAIILGTEGEGLPQSIIDAADYVVRIPMYNNVDSLNVAAAASIAFWEIKKGVQ